MFFKLMLSWLLSNLIVLIYIKMKKNRRASEMYKTLVVYYESDMSEEEALSVVKRLVDLTALYDKHVLITDTHIISKINNGYRIIKKYDVESIKPEGWRR